MILRLFKTMTKQSIQSICRSKNMSIASVGSVSATLVILGMILILILNINNMANTTKEQFDQIQIYLSDDLNQKQIQSLGQAIEKIDGISEVQLETKDKALENMKERLEEKGDMLDGLDKNPFQNSYIVYLDELEKADSAVKEIKNLNGIDDVIYYKDIMDKLISVASSVRIGGIILIVILLLISVFIISNTIKITVAARQREISIMKYVGATNGFIRGPFIIEGVLLGFVGSVLSIFMVIYGYKYIFSAVNNNLYDIFTIYMISPKLLTIDIIIIFISMGVGIGMLGSILSLRKFLKV
ncbi:hypothetical protein DUF214 [Gottschalkia acidurici 9a]|uniref:Cell division protein FtsX n=1 Tax=Gottschalkia acidurici (strain ATCC 7906 / DSM 604 / BCRC 14475 / CIP 104303 / KCTC 5404 / NCIMB 10678 / 9a) TaxID=1128398 RepID=K0B1R9_GOTA9|nr:permease-like cell division protein FtsX [Gottschalkia acidurici]AFS79062.1 hypothetical protein DUF214 [Gottschalkia acidurici 9a]